MVSSNACHLERMVRASDVKDVIVEWNEDKVVGAISSTVRQ
ncbi:hypothetical protein [Rossellomorea marisflavi]|nr:hypothetical protein [Rossellomorea marisflavi]